MSFLHQQVEKHHIHRIERVLNDLREFRRGSGRTGGITRSRRRRMRKIMSGGRLLD